MTTSVTSNSLSPSDENDDHDSPSLASSPMQKLDRHSLSSRNAPASEEEEEEDGDDDDDDEQEERGRFSGQQHQQRGLQNTQQQHPLMLGGLIDRPAYCLLDGMHEEEGKRVQFPISNLPVILGRSSFHSDTTNDKSTSSNNSNSNFIPMGKYKALSRQHLKIEYRTKMGTFYRSEKTGKFVYKPERMKKPPIERKGPGGFYVITCMGKNRIAVDGEYLKQGEQAVVDSGSTVKVGSLLLYFLLPIEQSTTAVQIPMQKRKIQPGPATATLIQKQQQQPQHHHQHMNHPHLNKKPKLAGSGSSTSGNDKVPTSPVSSTSASVTGAGAAHGAWPTLQLEIDSLTTNELLRQLSDAIESDTWERRHQLIGSTVSYRAVLEAAQDKRIIQIAEEQGGVSRSEIMKWISTSKRFSKWVHQMLSKLEDKSYQASITKALIKANFVRTASSGRYIKWLLPKDVYQGVPQPPPKSTKTKASSSSSSKTAKTAKPAATGTTKLAAPKLKPKLKQQQAQAQSPPPKKKPKLAAAASTSPPRKLAATTSAVTTKRSAADTHAHFTSDEDSDDSDGDIGRGTQNKIYKYKNEYDDGIDDQGTSDEDDQGGEEEAMREDERGEEENDEDDDEEEEDDIGNQRQSLSHLADEDDDDELDDDDDDDGGGGGSATRVVHLHDHHHSSEEEEEEDEQMVVDGDGDEMDDDDD